MTAPTSAGLATAPGAGLGRAEFEWISAFLRQRTGIELKDGKQALVVGRLDRRVRALGLPGFAAYVELLAGPDGADEARIATDLLTTNETFFFREQAHFDRLPELLTAAPPGRQVRVWSAACSTGEEAWSAALVAASTLRGRPWEVLGTDVSTRVLDVARRGVYPLEAAAQIPDELRAAGCLRGKPGSDADGTFTFTRTLRAAVRFDHGNLLHGALPDGEPFDVVFLRNVLIYFSADTKRRVLRRVVSRVRPGGHLLIGHADSVTGLSEGLEVVAPAVLRVPR